MENKGVEFIAQEVMDTVLGYAKFPVTIQSYAKSQSYTKAEGKLSDPKNSRRTWCRAAAAATLSTSE